MVCELWRGMSWKLSACLVALSWALGAELARSQEIDNGQTIHVPGDVPSPWNLPRNLDVGVSGEGTLIIEPGGAVTAARAVNIGLNAGSSGHTTLTGPNATVQATGTQGVGVIGVGNFGNGTLIIESGGQAKSIFGWVGYGVNSISSATVTGTNSTWLIGGIVGPGGYDTYSLSVGVHGSGTLTIADGGTVSVGDGQGGVGNGTVYLGTKGNSSGTLNIGGALGSAPVAPGALLASTVVFGPGAGVVNFNHTDMAYIFAPTITGSGTVNVLAGTTIFTADNTYAGNTTIASGAALSLGNGGTTGNVVGPIFNSGVLAFDHSNTFIVPGVIAGTGAVQQNGTSTTILTADNLYTGGTTINDGSLQLGNGGLSGSIVGDVTNNATLIFNRSNTYNFDGTISGAGSVGQIGTGTTTFNTPQDYTGTTNINAGVLEVNSTLASPAVNVNAGGTLAGIGDLVGHVVNAGTVAPGTSLVGFGTLTVGSYAGLGGTLTIDTQLGDDNSPTDQLIIDGGTATGTTGVIVTNQGGLGAQTTNGIPIILPTGGATIAAGTFGASGSVVPGAAAGVYQYLLYQGTEAGGGSAEAEQTYYLRSHEGDTPLYRPDVSIHSILANMARRQELATLGTFHERNGDQRWPVAPATARPLGAACSAR